jgi:hypothetical protein
VLHCVKSNSIAAIQPCNETGERAGSGKEER